MSTDQQGSRRQASDQQEPVPSGDLAHSVASRLGWVQQVLSPWVQRRLRDAGKETRLDRHTRTALTIAHTNFFLGRAQSKTDRATVWQPNVGSLEPAMVDRFSNAIVDRFPEADVRSESQPLEIKSAESPDLILAGVAEESPSEPEKGEGFMPFPSFAAFREALEDQIRSPRPPPTPRQPPPQVQRAATSPYVVRRPSRTLPPRTRLFSQVEEVTPGGKGLTGDRTSPAQAESPLAERRAEEGAATWEEQRSFESEMEPAAAPDQPVERPSVQRYIEEEKPSQEIQLPETAPLLMPSAAEAGPPQPGRPTELPLPPAQRLPDREVPSQVEARPAEEAPLLEVERGEPVPPEAPPPSRPPTAQVEPPEPGRPAEPPSLPLVQRLPDREVPPPAEETHLVAVERFEPVPPEAPPPSRPPAAQVEPPEPGWPAEPPSLPVQRLPDREAQPPAEETPLVVVERLEPVPPEAPPPSRPPTAQVEPPEPGWPAEPPSPLVQRQPAPDAPVRAEAAPPVAVERFEPVLPEAPPSRPTAAEAELPEPSRPAEPPSLPLVQRQPVPDAPVRAEARPAEEVTPVVVERFEPVPPEAPPPPSRPPPAQVEPSEPIGPEEPPPPPPVKRKPDRAILPQTEVRPAEEVPRVAVERFEPVLPKVPSRPLAAQAEPPEPGRPAEPPLPLSVRRRPDREVPSQAEAPPAEEVPFAEEERFEPVSPDAPLPPLRPPAAETEPSEPGWPAEPPSLPPVQRWPDRDIPVRAEARPTEEALPGEVERVEPVSPEVLAPPSSLTQRRAEFAEPPPQPDEPAAGLERDLLARGAVRARRPLTELLRPGRGLEPKRERVEAPEPAESLPGAHDRLLQTRPLEQTAILPQARGPAFVADEQTQGPSADLSVPDRSRLYTLAHPLPVPRRAVISRRETGVERVEIADGSAVRPQLLKGELPLPLLRQPVSTEQVQRQPDVGRVDVFPGLAVAPESVGIVQRVSTEPPPETEQTSEEKSDLELDRLARQVYPFIKRLLAVERERRSGRWG